MFESIKNNMPYSSDDIGLGTPKEGDHDLQEFLLMEKQKAQLNAQRRVVWKKFLPDYIVLQPRRHPSSAETEIHEFNDICWEKCMDKPGSKIDTRTETCLNNCVDRFIDVSLLITNRFAQLLQKSAM